MRILKKGGLGVILLACAICFFTKANKAETAWKTLTDADKQEVITLLAENKPEEMYFPTYMPEGMDLKHAACRTDGDTVTVECYFENLSFVGHERYNPEPPEMKVHACWFLQSNDSPYMAKQSGMEEGQTLQEGTYQFHSSQLGNTLCWKQGSLTCILRSELSQEDMRKIAQSIQPI